MYRILINIRICLEQVSVSRPRFQMPRRYHCRTGSPMLHVRTEVPAMAQPRLVLGTLLKRRHSAHSAPIDQISLGPAESTMVRSNSSH
jgi:hypothetical protein